MMQILNSLRANNQKSSILGISKMNFCLFFFWLHLQHVEVPRPGIKTTTEATRVTAVTMSDPKSTAPQEDSSLSIF